MLLALVLGPAAFGTWALLRLSTRYMALTGLAVFRGLERELVQAAPHSVTGRDSPAASALGFALLSSGGVATLALAASFLVPDSGFKLLLRAFAAASVTESVYNYALVCLRIRTSLRHYAGLESGTAFLHLVFGVGMGWLWGLGGAFVGLTLANLAGVAIAARWIDLRPALHPKVLRRLLSVGLPIALSIGVGILLGTVDRWVVAAWGGPTMLGYYTLAASVTAAGSALALVIRTVVFTQVYGEATSAGASAAVRAHLERAVLPFARLIPPVLGVASVLLGPVLALAMPNYLEAIPPGRIFLLTGAAIGLVTISSIGAVAAGRQLHLPLFAAIALATTAALSIAAVLGGLGLQAVAGAAFTGQVLFASALLWLNAKEAGLPRSSGFVLSTLLPLIWCAISVAVVGSIIPGTDALSTVSALGLYLLLLLPLAPMWQAEWRRVARPALRRRSGRIDIPTF